MGACIGNKGVRVGKIVDELGGEKIDIVKYSDDPAKFIAEALSPATVLNVEVDPDGAHACKAQCPTGSFPWPSATRARTPALPPSSPAGRSTSAPKADFTANNHCGLLDRDFMIQEVFECKKRFPCECAPAAAR